MLFNPGNCVVGERYLGNLKKYYLKRQISYIRVKKSSCRLVELPWCIARMKLYEHMQNGHQDCVKVCNSELPGKGEGAGGLMHLSYNTQSAICFCIIGVYIIRVY